MRVRAVDVLMAAENLIDHPCIDLGKRAGARRQLAPHDRHHHQVDQSHEQPIDHVERAARATQPAEHAKVAARWPHDVDDRETLGPRREMEGEEVRMRVTQSNNLATRSGSASIDRSSAAALT